MPATDAPRTAGMPLPRHPGCFIEHALAGAGRTQTELAEAMRIPLQRLHLVIRGKRRITPDTAIRLGRCLGRSPEHWLALQQSFDLHEARRALDPRLLASMRRVDGGHARRRV